MAAKLAGLWRCGADRGAAAAEFALAVPLVLILIMGGADYGFLIYQQAGLVAAARAGVEYAKANPGQPIPASYAALPGAAFNPRTSTTVCTCSDGASPPSLNPSPPDQSSCSASAVKNRGGNRCAGSILQYARVTAMISNYHPLISSAGLFFPKQLSATAYLRVQ